MPGYGGGVVFEGETGGLRRGDVIGLWELGRELQSEPFGCCCCG